MGKHDGLIIAGAILGGGFVFREQIKEFLTSIVKAGAESAGQGAAQSLIPNITISAPNIDLSGLFSGFQFSPGSNVGYAYSPPEGVPSPYLPGGSGTRLDANPAVVPLNAAQYRQSVIQARAVGSANLNPNLGPLAGWPGIPSLGIAGFKGLPAAQGLGNEIAPQRDNSTWKAPQVYNKPEIAGPGFVLADTVRFKAKQRNTRQPIKNAVAGSSDRYTSTEARQYGNTVSFVSIPQQLPASAYAASGGRPLWEQ